MLDVERPPAARAGIPVAGKGDISDELSLEVAREIHIAEVEPFLVRSRHEVPRRGD